MPSSASSSAFSIVVLLSGKGSNFKAILENIHSNKLNIEVRAVISDKPDAKGLVIAKGNQIDHIFLNPNSYTSREDYDLALQDQIDTLNVDLIVLAGFMRILSSPFVSHFSSRLINIHPSLLPKLKGLNTHQRALDQKEGSHGCSVHFVNSELDGGPVIAQANFSIQENDNKNTLQAKVHQLEHKLYPLVIKWIAEKRVSLEKEQLTINPKIQEHELPNLES